MKYDFIAIDFETANSSMGSACSMGIVYVADNQIVDEKYFLIKPPLMVFDEDNVKIHGISQDMVEDAPTFDMVWEKIKDDLCENTLVAHNAQFDMSVLKCCLEYYEIDIPDIIYVCSIPISTKVCEGKSTKLVDRAAELGIPIDHAHNALSDAKACAQLVIKTLDISNSRLKTNPRSFEKFCSVYSSIKVKTLLDLKAQKQFSKGKQFGNKIAITSIQSTVDTADENHIFFNKRFVFTGELSGIARKDAMQEVVNKGGILQSSVNKKLDYLVLGVQDLKIVGKDGMSSKERKAKEFISAGIPIKILNEQEFIALLNS